MRFFIGFENISSTVSDIQRCFVSKGHSCYTALHRYPNVIELNTADFIFQREFEKIPLFKPRRISVPLKDWWNKRVKQKFFSFCLKNFDVFIFFWDTFEPDYSDLELLKKKGKKIVFVFAGDDARWREAASQEFEKYGMKRIPVEDASYYTPRYLENNLKRIRHAEKFADMIFSRLDQAQLQLRPYFRWNMMVEPASYPHQPVQRPTNPRIVHAPTSRKIKGTDFVYKAFEKLKQDGIEFTPVLVENTPHKEALKIYADADILIDQLILPGTGKFASEGLAMGKVVVSLMAYDSYPQNNPSDCPIVDANPDTIYQVLKELILDHGKRVSIAAKGRVYTEKYLLPSYFCDKIISWCNNRKDFSFDYLPKFFREEFVPEADNLSIYNEQTKFVRHCDWYETQITSGERKGLVF